MILAVPILTRRLSTVKDRGLSKELLEVEIC